MSVGFFNHTLLRCARAILVFVHSCFANTFSSFSILCEISRYVRDGGPSSTSWYSKKWAPPTEKDRSTKGSCSEWSKRDTPSTPGEYENKHHHQEDSRAQDSANDTEGATAETHDRATGNVGCTEDVVTTTKQRTR